MRISLIVAAASNGVIGRDGDLPWRLPADLRRFKALTMGHHLLVGRKTWASIGRPLPGRKMVVISRDPALGGRLAAQGVDGVQAAESVEEALAIARRAGDEEVFIGGGAEVYRNSLAEAARIQLTRVYGEPAGDAFFPQIDPASWRLVQAEGHPADEKNELPYSFLVYERRLADGGGSSDD